MRSGRFTRAALSLCMHRISCYFPVSLSVIIAAVACFSPNLPTCVVCLHVALELWSMCCWVWLILTAEHLPYWPACPHGQASFQKDSEEGGRIGRCNNAALGRTGQLEDWWTMAQFQACRVLHTWLKKIPSCFLFLWYGVVIPCQELDWMTCSIFLVLNLMSMWPSRQKHLTVINSRCFQLLINVVFVLESSWLPF